MNRLLWTLTTLLFAYQAPAQIGVNVDGRAVVFSGTPPQQVQGRVLVPLRGVLEAMGAYVEYQAATGTILASKGATQIRMRLGDRNAVVNGSNVTLDVPAMSVGGRTMVPLRFVGEALGADVRWNASTQVVDINTTGSPNPGTGGNIEIRRIDVRAPSESLKPGDEVEVTMEGTPGAVASFRIPGLVDRVTMREESSGVYKATWTVPRNASLSGARVLGEMSIGSTTRLIQASGSFSVDGAAPRITSIIPEDRARVMANRLSVSAVFDDGTGSGVDPNSVRLLIDGNDVTEAATVNSSFVTWRPTRDLAAGVHSVTVTARDRAGNTLTRSWEFTVSDATGAIQSFTHDATGRVEPGDVITVTLRGEAGATVTYAIGSVRGLTMRETQPGTYVGTYTVRRGDNFANSAVVATMRTASGDTYTVDADRTVNGSLTNADAPRITSHQTGDFVQPPLVLRGTAAPNARVRIKVDYATTVVGGFRLTGGLYEGEVVANTAGAWQTDSIPLRLLVSGEDTVYTVTASLVVPAGQTSPEPTVIQLKKR
jgi:hypothetical protein